MVIKKEVIKVCISGIIKTKQVKFERWLTTRYPNYVYMIIKHNGDDWIVSNPNEWGIYRLIEKVSTRLENIKETTI